MCFMINVYINVFRRLEEEVMCLFGEIGDGSLEEVTCVRF